MGDSKSINIFLAKIFGFFFIWLILDNWLSHVFVPLNIIWTYFYHVLLVIINGVSSFGLEVLGYEVVNNYRSVAIVGSYGVVIGNHCVGLELIYAFVALIISYPGPWKKKLWFIPSGVALILFSNILRVILLSISIFKKGGYVDIDQHDFFNYIIYALIFVLWIVWVQLAAPKNPFIDNTSTT